MNESLIIKPYDDDRIDQSKSRPTTSEKKIESQHNTTAASDKIVSSQNILMWAYIIAITCLYEKVRKCVHFVKNNIQPDRCTDIHKMITKTICMNEFISKIACKIYGLGGREFFIIYIYMLLVYVHHRTHGKFDVKRYYSVQNQRCQILYSAFTQAHTFAYIPTPRTLMNLREIYLLREGKY